LLLFSDDIGFVFNTCQKGHLCRPSAGLCDPEELCEGTASCPADQFFGRETTCRPANATLPCDAPDVCDGRSAACPETFKAQGDVCRPVRSGAECDVAETCTGRSPLCPDNQFAKTGTSCDDGNRCTDPDSCNPLGQCVGRVLCSCDDDKACDDGNPCTVDKCDKTKRDCVYTAAPAGTICRPTRGMCDPEELCQGMTCADDVLLQSNQACRPKADLCDVAELCTGRNFNCPPNLIASNNTLCRQPAGDCDVADRCNGRTIECVDVFLPQDTQCSAPTTLSPCAGVAHCSGTSAQCPAPVALDGTACNDSDNCTMSDVCVLGQCSGQRTCACIVAPDCDDKNSCTTESCVDKKCVYTSLPAGMTCVGDPLRDSTCSAAGFCVALEPTLAPATTSAISAATTSPIGSGPTQVDSATSMIAMTPLIVVALLSTMLWQQ
jgi:hypothetical protein